MKTLEQLVLPKQVDSNFPFGAIINETLTSEGTPVIREVYNDILVNNYKLLQSVGVVPNNTEDNETNGYQILEALKKFPNVLNDIEQVLSLSANVWNVHLNIDLLPNKYFFFARATEDYVLGTNYIFKGTTTTTYNFTSTGFKALDELLVIIDISGVRAYPLNSKNTSDVFASLATPIAFNETNKMYYQEDGFFISDDPSTVDLQNIIRENLSNNTIILQDIFVIDGLVVCFCLIPNTINYFFRYFPINNLSLSYNLPILGASFSNSIDLIPYIYATKGSIFVTNQMNSNADNFITKLNLFSNTLVFDSVIEVDNSFVKTTNSSIKSGLLYTMSLGLLESYNLTNGNKVNLGNYKGVIGQLFSFNGNIYFNSGEVCKKWF